jgi:hypothetical protein
MVTTKLGRCGYSRQMLLEALHKFELTAARMLLATVATHAAAAWRLLTLVNCTKEPDDLRMLTLDSALAKTVLGRCDPP